MATYAFVHATLPEQDKFLPVDMRGNLRIDTPTGRAATLHADGGALSLDLIDRQDLLSMGPSSLASRRRALVAAARLLTSLGIRLDVKVAGRDLLAFGAGIQPTIASCALRLGTVHLPFSALLSLWRR